ncbi:hypothetical protein GCM10028805_25810 [Spirosoma harenae]
MESVNTSFVPSVSPITKPARVPRRKVNGEATAAILIQMASEILISSPTLRKRINVSLSDLVAADKVRKELNRKSVSHH